jgi:hypothetical protein
VPPIKDDVEDTEKDVFTPEQVAALLKAAPSADCRKNVSPIIVISSVIAPCFCQSAFLIAAASNSSDLSISRSVLRLPLTGGQFVVLSDAEMMSSRSAPAA